LDKLLKINIDRVISIFLELWLVIATNYTAKKAMREIMLNNNIPLPANVNPTFPVFKPMATLITPITSSPKPVHKAHIG
jgi:hypothetical protein